MKEWEEKERNASTTWRPAAYKQKRAWKIHRCRVSGKLILPRQLAWCKTYHHYRTGSTAFSEWMCNEYYLMEKLKGTL